MLVYIAAFIFEERDPSYLGVLGISLETFKIPKHCCACTIDNKVIHLHVTIIF